jgi:hypothetical protein
MARKKTFLLNHELIDGIRFLNAEQFKAIICGLADMDERKEPETKDSIALAFINREKGFILENAEKWEKKCADAKSAREKRAELRTENPDSRTDNSDSRTDNSDSSSVTVSVSVSDPVSVSENDDEESATSKDSSSSDSESFPKKESIPRQTSPPNLIPGNPPAVWDIIRNAWNRQNCRFTCDKIYFNLSYDQRERVRGSMATYTPGQMVRAIEKYFEERKEKPDGYEYKSFYLFVEKGMDFYTEAT